MLDVFITIIMEVCNITLTTDLGTKLDLPALFAKNKATKYSPQTFPGLILKVMQPKATLLIFKSGKVVCVGSKNIQSGENAIKYGLESMGLNTSKLKISPQLFVGSGNLGYAV